ncbi:kinase domain-containing [Fusarium acutatum]|uniref:Kinase domain-containing n=1 Tax=Fusarium acutatum TaxID=78861 RepID=A0A8H4NDA1_9HYPO|nr:kinase domain-containing [Fusarium acutatum]
MYEITTRDETLRAVRHEKQNVLEIEQKDWAQHPDVQLDHPVSEFRKVLREWSKKYRRGKQITTYKDAPNFIDWPDTPQPPPSEMFVYYDEQGKTVLNWQRPV